MSSNPSLALAPDKPRWHHRMISHLAAQLGYRVTSSKRRLNLGDAAKHLLARGVNPSTVIDVGVAWGTEELYAAFPKAHLLLVEPNPQWQSAVKTILGRHAGEAIFCAAGDTTSTLTFHVWHGAEGSSSLLRSSIPSDAKVSSIDVPMQRLDAIARERGCKPPFVVKIDVQGAERTVLDGMTGMLSDVEAIIVESSLFGGDTVPEFHEIARWMNERGWKLYDIVGFNYRPRDGALAQIDAVFVPDVGRARDSHEWH